jgi:hypothetical protein
MKPAKKKRKKKPCPFEGTGLENFVLKRLLALSLSRSGKKLCKKQALAKARKGGSSLFHMEYDDSIDGIGRQGELMLTWKSQHGHTTLLGAGHR